MAFNRRATFAGIPARSKSESSDEESPVIRSKSAPLFLQKSCDILRPSTFTVDCMTYQSPILVTWQVFWLHGVKTAFGKATTWWMMLTLTLIGLAVGTLPGLLLADPSMLSASKFNRIAEFLNGLVCFVLGFYFSLCVARWFACVDGLMEIFDAIRNLQIQMHALGVPDEDKHRIVRYAVLSPWLLSEGLRISATSISEEKEKEATDELWAEIVEHEPGLEEVDYDFKSISPDEERLLREVDDPATVMWVWVASMIGRLAQDGILPPAVCSTYGRILENVQSAQSGIRKVVVSSEVKTPYMYMNLLSWLVHVNNITNAINFGIALGALMATFASFRAADELGFHPRPDIIDLFPDAENFVVVLFVNMFGPLLYLGLLDVSVCIAEPFSNRDTDIPVRRLLEILTQDLEDRSVMAVRTPSWEPPCFKPS